MPNFSPIPHPSEQCSDFFFFFCYCTTLIGAFVRVLCRSGKRLKTFFFLFCCQSVTQMTMCQHILSPIVRSRKFFFLDKNAESLIRCNIHFFAPSFISGYLRYVTELRLYYWGTAEKQIQLVAITTQPHCFHMMVIK